MASVDEVAASLGANKSEAEGLAGQLAASKQQTEELQGEIAALGAEGAANGASAAAQAIEGLMAEATGLADRIGQAQAQVLAIKKVLLTTATTSTGTPRPSTQDGQPAQRGERTRPSHPPDPNRKPGGQSEPVDLGSSARNQVGIRGQVDAAIVLARSGYDITHCPPPKPNGKRPDYFMEGDYWDGYTVLNSNPERVRKSIKKKVNPKDCRPQAHRIVVNLDMEFQGTRTALTKEDIEGILRRKPLAGLKELKVIADGRVHDIDLGD